MKKATIDRFKDYSPKFEFSKDIIVHNLSFLYPKPLMIIALVALVIVSIINYRALCFFFPLLIIYWYQFQTLQKAKVGLKFKRVFPETSKEEKTELVEYRISNPYDFHFANLVIKDKFDGERLTPNKKGILFYFDELQKKFRFHHQRPLKLNNGMGKKHFGPMTLFLSDSIGLHFLKYVYEKPSYMKVYPKVYSVKAPKTLPYEHSIEFGLHDSTTRGENINFYQTREYREGDSINKINWKLTVKSHKVIVNEFENNSNSRVNIVLIDDQRVHTGDGAFSSFEYAKDIALSLCHHHINSNNSIGLFCHQKYIKPSSGRSHLVSLEMFAGGLELAELSAAELYHRTTKVPVEIQQLEKKISTLINEGSNSYIITGFVPGKLWDYYLKLFETTARKSKATHITLIDGIDEVVKRSDSENQLWLSHMKSTYPEAKAEFEAFCKKNGIKYSIVKVDNKIKEAYRIKDAFRS